MSMTAMTRKKATLERRSSASLPVASPSLLATGASAAPLSCAASVVAVSKSGSQNKTAGPGTDVKLSSWRDSNWPARNSALRLT
jgi:hypothetical protein